MTWVTDDEALAALYEAVTHVIDLQRRFAPHYLGSPDLRQGVEALVRLGETLDLVEPETSRRRRH